MAKKQIEIELELAEADSNKETKKEPTKRQKMLAARKIQLQRKMRGYGKLPRVLLRRRG